MKTLFIVAVASLMAGHWNVVLAVPVFSKIDNLEPSAQIAKVDLLQNIFEIVEVPWVQVNAINERLQWVRESDLWSAVDLSQFGYLRPQAELKTTPKVTAANYPLNSKSGIWEIVDRQEPWLAIRRPHQFQKYWVRRAHFQADPDSWGVAVVVESAPLLLGPHSQAHRACQVAAQTRVKIQGFNGHYAKVFACGGTGYVHLSKLLTKAHFATRVQTVDQQWHTLIRVNTNEVITTDFRPLHLSQIQRFELDSKIRFTRRPQTPLFWAPTKNGTPSPFRLPLMARLRILQSQVDRWAHSKIQKLGVFWWNMKASDISDYNTPTRIRPKQIFTGKIFDVASHPTNPKIKIVSAQGVYLTRNGHNWEKLSQFADENYPLFITSSGLIFVGPYMSLDQGQSFKPYIRWEKLLAALGGNNLSLSKLRISEIQVLDSEGEKIKLTVYVGNHPNLVFTSDRGRTWSSF